jgi:inosine-uridine nucleoside N-ribohydrolase
MCDLVAAAVLVEPGVVVKKEKRRVRVALSGEARGALLIDWYNNDDDADGISEAVTLIESVNVEMMLKVCSVLK